LLQLEGLVNDTVDLDLAAVKVVNGGREFIRLGERSKNGDFIANYQFRLANPTRQIGDLGQLTDFGWRPADTVLVSIHAVHDEFTTTANIVDGIFQDLRISGSLDNNVKAVRVINLELLELYFRVATRQSDVLVSGAQFLSQIHLETLWSGDDNMATTILAQHLRKNKASRAGAEHEDR
jgi:hypothetical protein